MSGLYPRSPPAVPMMTLKPHDSIKVGGLGVMSAAPAGGLGTHGLKKGRLGLYGYGNDGAPSDLWSNPRCGSVIPKL